MPQHCKRYLQVCSCHWEFGSRTTPAGSKLLCPNRRVELRLTEKDYQNLRRVADFYGTTLTHAVEILLRTSQPLAVRSVQEVGVRGRRRVSIQFSNGMIVNGFLWSRGGLLLGPTIRAHGGYRVRIVHGSREFWDTLRRFCRAELGVAHEPQDARAGDRAAELVA
jgi:hypothetical protein